MRSVDKLSFMLGAEYRVWSGNRLVGYNLYAPLGHEVDYDAGEILWCYRAMLAEDIPRALQVIANGGSVQLHDFGFMPEVLVPDKIKLIDLFLGRLDRFAKSSGRNSYFEQVRDRELEASLLTPEREELHTSIIQLAA
jgi:hypothetical protein